MRLGLDKVETDEEPPMGTVSGLTQLCRHPSSRGLLK